MVTTKLKDMVFGGQVFAWKRIYECKRSGLIAERSKWKKKTYCANPTYMGEGPRRSTDRPLRIESRETHGISGINIRWRLIILCCCIIINIKWKLCSFFAAAPMLKDALTSSTCACVCCRRRCAAICCGVLGPPTGMSSLVGASPPSVVALSNIYINFGTILC